MLDGNIARLTDRVTKYGGFLDSTSTGCLAYRGRCWASCIFTPASPNIIRR
ncbi:MAG: CDP-alcohol phosphatidyltransferase family protein [Acidobacteria bacterium]|nr:CDP-alcohol phosphatidyltransferase family protein [Acidobacteriota bacterium]